MKIIAKPVDMIAWFDKNGVSSPLKFRFVNIDDSNFVVKVDKVITRAKEKFAGNEMILFRCQSIINGIEKVYELKFEVKSCKWMIYKI
jgi:hypothetical protein